MSKVRAMVQQLPNRRRFCQSLLAAAVAGANVFSPAVGAADQQSARSLLRKQIPGSNETVPCIGMGSWITFDVPQESGQWDQRVEVLQTFFEHGGSFIDSSPMYGHAEEVIGYCLKHVAEKQNLFAASKIWTPAAFMGGSQMSNTESLWGVKPMDLMFVHNLLAWKKHLPMLREWKASGRIRYLGVSTSHGRRHEELEALMRAEKIDFIQLTLNIEQTEVEERILPLAMDLGIAVVVNRPFQRGALFDRYQSHSLPPLAVELGCENWAQCFLLYAISHPAVTCAIPATSQVAHMQENMRALRLELPTPELRKKMRDAVIQI